MQVALTQRTLGMLVLLVHYVHILTSPLLFSPCGPAVPQCMLGTCWFMTVLYKWI